MVKQRCCVRNMLALLCAGILWLFSANTLACSCIAPNTLRDFNEAQHVFLAEVNAIVVVQHGHDENLESGEVHGYFDVVKTYKGEPVYVTHLVAQHKPLGGMCGETLSRSLYLVFANENGGNYVSMCSPTKPTANAHPNRIELLERLSNNEPPRHMYGEFNGETGLVILSGETQGQRIYEGTFGVYGGHHLVEFEGYQLNSGDVVIANVISTREQVND